MGIIGEQFTEGQDICGVVVSIRNKQDRVALWTSTASNEAAQVSLGKEFKAILDIPDRQTIGFLAHVRDPICHTHRTYHLELSSFS
jgi:translation initiation factor 4E